MQGDLIGGPVTGELAGAYFVYKYSTGRRYRLDFTAQTVTFALESQPGVLAPAHTLPYRARTLRDDLYLVHWISPDRSIHVSLVIDVGNRQLHVSAVMAGKLEFFDIATIEQLHFARTPLDEQP